MKHYYKDALDYAIVDILEAKELALRYHELEGEIRSYCSVSSATLSLHLRALVGGNVLQRRIEKNGHTFYSLTSEFKEALEIQKKHYPTNYLEETLLLSTFRKRPWFSFRKVKFYARRRRNRISNATNHE